MQHPPGPRGRQVFGFLGNGSANGTLRFLERMARQYGPVASFRLFHKRIYLVDDPELIRDILVTRQHEFVRDSGATLLRELVGDGLLTREEPEHRERRRMLQPAFHRDQIASYAAAMVRETERLSKEWSSKESFDVRLEMRRLTLSIVGATLFGADFSGSAGQIAAILRNVFRRSTWLAPAIAFIEPVPLAYRRLFPNGRSLFFHSARKELEAVIQPLIQNRRQSGSMDVLSLILNQQTDAGSVLTDEQVRNEIVTFVLAGHETTATALTWTWYLLAQHPEVEARLCSEIDSVLGDRSPSLEDTAKLTYTANVFKEAMRLYPPALLFARRPKQKITLAGYEVSAGQSIFLSPYITQRNPKYFERPDSFEPDRWEQAEPPKFAYFPFGGGAKMCIGEPFAKLEGLLALAALARRWRLTREDRNPVGIAAGVVLAPDQPIMMRPVARAADLRGVCA